MNFPLEFQDPPGFAPEFSPDRHPGIIRDEDFILLRSITNPEGGIKGGQIIAEGSPEKITEISSSYTGDFLKNIINSSLKKTA